MHPNGQIPAYEWNFSDVNPPVHAWAAIRVFELDGGTDFTFLARIFHKLLINFTWWVDNKDHGGQQPVRGRLHGAGQHRPARPVHPAARRRATWSRPTPPPGWRCTPRTCWTWRCGWPVHDIAYEDVATKFFEHFLTIAGAANSGRTVGRRRTPTSTTCCTWPTASTCRSRSSRWSAWCRCSAALAYDQRDRRATCPTSAPGRSGSWPTIRSTCRLFHIRDIAGVRHRLLAMVPPDRLIRVLDNVFEEDGLLSRLRHQGDLGLAPGTPVQRPGRRRHRVGRLRTGRVDHRTCSAATPTGADRSGCR